MGFSYHRAMQAPASTPLDRANAMIDRGELERAKVELMRLARTASNDVGVLAPLSFVLAQLQDHERAAHYARRTAELLPHDARAQHNAGNSLLAARRSDEAEAFLRRAIELDERMEHSWLALSNTLRARGKPLAAAALLREAIARCGARPLLLNNLSHALHSTGRSEGALGLLEQAVSSEPDHILFVDGLCSLLNYVPGVGCERQFEAHVRYGALVRRAVGPAPRCPRWPALSGGRLRLGLLSPDLRDHAVAHLIRALIEHADRDRVEIACYFVGPSEDAMSQTLRASADLWCHAAELDMPALAARIRSDRVHALVDLAGHTGLHRLAALTHRPAPLIATYMGYPNTTGLDCVDLRITDSTADPPSAAAFNTERLAHLDPCFLSYTPPRDIRPSPSPSATSGVVTFGYFGSMLKVNDALVALWSRVLESVPGSRLLLKNTGLAESEAREDLRARFGAFGVDPARIVCEGPGANSGEMLAHYARVDISLDSFPYTGTTTICESLLSGVPVVSMAGDTSPSRVSRSILSCVGAPELVATCADGYVRLAAELAGDAARLASLRSSLREKFLASPICDGQGFADRFVSLVQAKWDRGGDAR